MSGTVLGMALLVTSITAVGVTLPTCELLVESTATGAAADAAALAAADAASGRRPELPCSAADRLAAANGGTLHACEIDGTVVTIVVMRTIGALPVYGVATAGPP